MQQEKDWRNIGRVTVKDTQGRVKTYESLERAVEAVGYSTVMNLKKGHLGAAYHSDWAIRLWGHYYGGDSHVFVDELGLKIPLWKVQEAARHSPNPPICCAWRKRHVRPEHFRKLPVPYCRGWKRKYRGIRSVRTTQEIRENDFLRYDEDALEYGVKARGDRRRHNLPTRWDDVPHARQGNNWKRHRRTRWKE